MLRFHPRILSPMDVVMAGLVNDRAQCSSESRFESIKYHSHEMDEFYQLVLEIPGVKKSDVIIQILHGSILQIAAERRFPKELYNQTQDTTTKYRQSFAMDPKLVDMSRITANLEDGLLALKLTKKSPEIPIDIPVAVSSPESDNADAVILVRIDLPGVKSSNLKVKFVEDTIRVDAERMSGSNVIKVQKSATVNTRSNVKLEDFIGYLQDGVLTITARKACKNDTNEDATTSDDVVNIPVSGHTDTNKSQIKGKEKMADTTDHSEDYDVVVVETVVDEKKNDA